MLVDEEDFCQEVLDNSYGYAPTSDKICKTRSMNSNSRNYSTTAAVCDSSEKHSLSSYPFLRSSLNVSSPGCFAVETAIRAKCSPEAVEMIRQMDVGLSEIESIADELSKEDATRFSSQLKKELGVEWESSSLINELGVDDSGFVVGDSLLHTYDLLCNINLQLIVMQRELFRHETNIINLRNNGKENMSGYKDAENKAQLRKLLYSLTSAAHGLQNRIVSLNHVILNVCPLPEMRAEHCYARIFVIMCIGILGVGSLIRYFSLNKIS